MRLRVSRLRAYASYIQTEIGYYQNRFDLETTTKSYDQSGLQKTV